MRTNFENLRVYLLAEQLADEVWKVVRKLGNPVHDTVGKQLVPRCGQHWSQHRRGKRPRKRPGLPPVPADRSRFAL